MLTSMILVIGMSISLASGVGAGFLLLIRGDWLVLIGGLVFLFAIAAHGSATALEWGRLPRLMQSGLVTSLISFCGCLLIILYGFRFSPEVSDFLSKLIATTALWSLWCGLTGGLIKRKTRSHVYRIFRRATMFFAGVSALLLDGMIWMERFQWPLVEDPLFLVLTALGGLTVLSATGCKLLFGLKLATEDEEDPALVKRLSFEMICPRCQSEQSLVTGKARCEGCGLIIKVIVP